jgi:hypothetical protein
MENTKHSRISNDSQNRKLKNLVIVANHIFKRFGLKLFALLVIRKAIESAINALNVVFLPQLQDGYVVKRILGSKMFLDLADPGVSREIITDSIREPISTTSYINEIKEGNVLVDIGANIGYTHY